MSRGTLREAVLVWGWTLSVFLLATYLICIAFSLLVPASFHMHEAWSPLLPGFEWLTWQGFLAGAVGIFAYGWYIGILAVPLFRIFRRRFAE